MTYNIILIVLTYLRLSVYIYFKIFYTFYVQFVVLITHQ